jgi:hypothetical protein
MRGSNAVAVDIPDPFDRIKGAAGAFKQRLTLLRTTTTLPDGRQWFPYDSLGNVWSFDQMLTGANRHVFSDLAGKAIADIGAADGDLGFLLESLGADVDIIDNPATNMNSLEGASALKRGLNSRARIHNIDLDTHFILPGRYDFVLFLGLLYHLKNPFYALEHLAHSVSHAFLSTRVMAYSAEVGAHGRTLLKGIPCAYLVDADESNNDATNFWMFTEAGLLRLFKRTGWDVLDYKVLGDMETSDPYTGHGDRRAFCLLRSSR